MSHIPINKLFLLLLCCCIYLAGCTGSSKKSEDDSVSESKEGFSSTEVMGSLGHGLASYLVDEDIGAAYVMYEGGELKIEYKASSTGMFECGVGFMIFIDGVAQPYEFSFYFVPTVGQKGDMLELCIASIYNPAYQPDMDESKGYGIFHDMLPNSYIIKYDASPAKVDSEFNDLDLISSFNRAEEGNSKIILNEFSGTINCVEDDGLLLVDTRRILQMDSLALEVQKEAENTAPLLINPQVQTTEDAYLLMGETFEGWSFKLIEYDRNLQLKQTADIAEAVVSEREIMTCKLFSGGDKFLYNNINGLYLFDFASDKTTNLTQDGIFIYDFACLEQTGEILFSGSNSSEERVLGIVGMDGEKQQEERAGHLWGGIWAFEDFALIEEAELVGREREGVVFRYDAEGGIRSFSLYDSNENGNITVSCHGDYYATRTKLVGEESHYVIRIYSSKDGNMVKEMPLTYEEYGDDFRLRGFLICDDIDRIILYGTWKGQETNTWIVSESL